MNQELYEIQSTREPTQAPFSGSVVLTTGSPGKSRTIIVYMII